MYILETEQSFDSAHFLSGYEGKCSNLHGHRWRVVARIAMDELNKEGQTRDMVIDFGDFKNALKKLTDALDHSFIFETGSLKERTVAALKDALRKRKAVGDNASISRAQETHSSSS